MKKENIKQFLNTIKIFDTPVMVYDLVQLESNIESIIDFEQKYNIKFLFPVKAFPCEKIIQVFSRHGFGYDVTNKNEYQLVKKYTKNSLLSFNGVNYDGLNVTNTKNVIYNLNSIYDVKKYKDFNGLRINPSNKHGYFSKFGIMIERLLKLPSTICNNIESISFHFYEKSESKKRKTICRLYKKIKVKFPKLKYLNIGGNWNILDKEKFENNLIYLRKYINEDVKIILETGEGWFENCGYLLAKVISYNDVQNKKIFYVNAVKESVAKWSILHPVNLNYKTNDGSVYIISGSSCYEKDIFHITKNKIDLDVGQTIIFKGLNGYSFAWNKEFNGSNRPEVIFYE